MRLQQDPNNLANMVQVAAMDAEDKDVAAAQDVVVVAALVWVWVWAEDAEPVLAQE